MNEVVTSPHLFNDIVQLTAAVASIAATISSWRNRRKLNLVDKKVDVVATKAVEAKKAAQEVKDAAIEQIQAAHIATIEKLEEVKEIVANNGKH